MARHSDPQRYWLTDFRCTAITGRGRHCRRYGDTTREPRKHDFLFVDTVRCRAHAKQPGSVLGPNDGGELPW